VRAGRARGQDLVRSVCARHVHHARLARDARDFEREIGRDDEARSGFERLLRLGGGEHGARSHHEIGVHAQLGHDVGRVRHGECDLDQHDPALGDRIGGGERDRGR
jgi:hypothetical protein